VVHCWLLLCRRDDCTSIGFSASLHSVFVALDSAKMIKETKADTRFVILFYLLVSVAAVTLTIHITDSLLEAYLQSQKLF
jgi:hypothetical protein